MLIFRITEIMARYKVSVVALSNELGIGTSAVSKWRQGAATPSFDRLNQVMNALKKIGDDEQLTLYPLQLSELLEWREEKDTNID
ncbi:MAG: helix-turn-helix transcriptional regulator [Leptolyngbya sp. SIO3F4]|nr:helix-turn-helix transcriptional regulator [Leptolyngbya sp. SIO3F4]